jgi:hypothetical protein
MTEQEHNGELRTQIAWPRVITPAHPPLTPLPPCPRAGEEPAEEPDAEAIAAARLAKGKAPAAAPPPPAAGDDSDEEADFEASESDDSDDSSSSDESSSEEESGDEDGEDGGEAADADPDAAGGAGPSAPAPRKRKAAPAAGGEPDEPQILAGLSGDEVDPGLIVAGGRGARHGRGAGAGGARPKYSAAAVQGSDEDEW